MRLFINLALFLFISFPAWATTFYVRDGGGTSTQCTGQVNAVYLGTGTNQPCAFNSPGWLLSSNNAGQTPPPALLASGDTAYVVGDSDISPGQQAQFVIGYTMPNAGYYCLSSAQGGNGNTYDYDCQMGLIPAGTDASHPTSIIGIGNHQPQFYGGPTQLALDAENSYITLSNIEITSHIYCGATLQGVNDCPAHTQRVAYGVYIKGTGYSFNNLYIHNVMIYGIKGTGIVGNATFTGLHLIGDQQGGFSTDPNIGQITGTLTWNQPIAEWSGCQEAYPMTNPGIDNPLNYSNCAGQGGCPACSFGIIADGIDFGGQTTGLQSGNWTFTGPGSISFNTKGGIDTLHGSGGGTILIDKMRFEGNGAQQIKTSANVTSVTNSVIVGDCGWWLGAPQTISGGMQADGDDNSHIGSCRATGNSFTIETQAGTGTTFNFTNNTVAVNNGTVVFLQGGSCSSTEHFNIHNNIVNGGYAFDDDTSFVEGGENKMSSYIYLSGTDGNGAGCTALSISEDYNVADNLSGGISPSGPNDKFPVSPGFSAGTFPSGTAGGGASTYYQGQAGVTLTALSSGSAANGTGNIGYIYWNNENDFNNVVRASSPSIGGLEINSCAALSYGCQFNSTCCNNSCSNNVCQTCTSNGNACTLNTDCCSNYCSGSVCGSAPPATTGTKNITGSFKITGMCNVQ